MLIGTTVSAQEPESLTARAFQGNLKIDVEIPGVFVSEDKDELAIEPKQYNGELIITKIAREGITVTEGDVLMEFDTANLEEALEQANTDVTDAQIELEKMKAELETAKIDEETSRSQLTKELAFAEREHHAAIEREKLELKKKNKEIVDAKRRLKDAEVDFEQLTQLYEERELHTSTENILIQRETIKLDEIKKSISRLEEELAFFMSFEKSKETLSKELALDKKKAEVRKQEIKGTATLKEKASSVAKAERKLKREQDKVADLKHDLQALKLVASRSGILFYGKTNETAAGLIFGGRRNNEMRIGGRVKTHDILMTVASMNNLAIKMQVPENDIQHMKPGLAITIRPDAFRSMVLNGELTKVDQIATRSNILSDVRRFTVKGKYEGELRQLRSGMNCRVTVHADFVPDAVQVPIVAVTQEKGSYYCFVKQGKRHEKRVVKIGMSNDDFVQIVEGVLPNEVVFLFDPSKSR